MNIKKILWFSAGMLLLGVAFVGIYLPGLPWSTPAVGAAYCFARSSERMHNWIYSHRIFGPFLIGWKEKKIFPTRLKYVMLATMSSSLLVLWFTTGNINAIIGTGAFMALVALWAWRYPSTVEEHAKRTKLGKRIGWLK